MEQTLLRKDETVILALRALYTGYGYQPYRMSKFEEYDLYAQNKKFLVSQNVITFPDASGKLLALKPDVTLSIVRNSKDRPEELERVCYDERVYRMDPGSHEFREIPQTGLECIGPLDSYAVGEVLLLAAKSLQAIDDNYLLDLSHMGFLQAQLEAVGLEESQQPAVVAAMGQKNVPEVERLCRSFGVRPADTDTVCRLTRLYGPAEELLPELQSLAASEKAAAAAAELQTLTTILHRGGAAGHINLDFALTMELDYYSGVVFSGFVPHVPSVVLSGGQYDNLMQKLGRKNGAIGFAVYLDQLERLDTPRQEYDVDILLTYEPDSDPAAVAEAAQKLIDSGARVQVQRSSRTHLRYRQHKKLTKGGLETIETNA